MRKNRLTNLIGLAIAIAPLFTDCTKPAAPHTPTFTTVYKNPKDTTYNCYTISLPKDTVKGLLVILGDQLTGKGQAAANSMGIITVKIIASKSPLDLISENEPIQRIDTLVGEIVNKYHIPKDKWVIGGMSVQGTAAFRYVQYCKQKHSKGDLDPAGVFGIDPPLDYERLWHESEDGVKRNFSQNAVDEGNFLMNYFRTKFGGSPHEKPEAYRSASPFSYSAGEGGNAHWFNNVPVRIYVEPNITWWIANRRKDFYDLNAMDQAGLINQLKLNGNKDAELKTSYDKGVAPDGSYHPHSWSILNEQGLLDWCLKLCKH